MTTHIQKIAIVGAGLSGLATCWHLLQSKLYQVTIYAPEGIYGGCSNVAAGLLHPYVGAHAKRNWQGEEGMATTRELLRIAENAYHAPVAQYNGILRVALTEQQLADYQHCIDLEANSSEVEWYSPDYCQKLIPGLAHAPAMMTHSGITVHTTRYLEGLWRACQAQGATLKPERIDHLADLKHYDRVVVATGASITQFPELAHLDIKSVKGQILELEWPQDIPPLPFSLNAQAYIAMHHDGKSCIVGSTYEKNALSEAPDLELAKREILPKVEALFPPLKDAKIIGCRAGMRATTTDRRPRIGNINPRLWYITGMSSRGLLYHALMAKQLVKMMINT